MLQIAFKMLICCLKKALKQAKKGLKKDQNKFKKGLKICYKTVANR